jgi:hypothetical protein
LSESGYPGSKDFQDGIFCLYEGFYDFIDKNTIAEMTKNRSEFIFGKFGALRYANTRYPLSFLI